VTDYFVHINVSSGSLRQEESPLTCQEELYCMLLVCWEVTNTRERGQSKRDLSLSVHCVRCVQG
jgi:hypothetical protein